MSLNPMTGSSDRKFLRSCGGRWQPPRLLSDNQVWRLHRRGCSDQIIAKKTGVSVRTVQRFLKTSSFPERHTIYRK